MRRKTTQTEWVEETNMVSEVELIYHSKVKPADRPLITNSIDAYKVLLNTWNKDTIELQEEFKVILLNRASRVLAVYKVGKGGLTGTIADPRLILAAALKVAACSIMLAHNHPSGNLKPSKADEELTKKVKGGAEFMDIRLLDHLIITPDEYFSFADMGLL
jgi:DNA repair protein RadC